MSATVPPTPDPQPSDRPEEPYGTADPFAPPPYAPAPYDPAPPHAPAPYDAAPPYQASPAPYGAAPAPSPFDAMRPPRQPGTDGLAITSLVTGVLGLALVAVGFGIAALLRVRRTGRSGQGLAIAGIILGGLTTVGWGVVLAVAFAVAGSEEFRESFSEGYTEGFEAATGYEVGQCLGDAEDPTSEIACTDPHAGEIVGVDSLTGASFPGEEAASAQAEEYCLEAFADYVGIDYMESELEMVYFYPTQASWSLGDRQIACWAETADGRELKKTVAGAAR